MLFEGRKLLIVTKHQKEKAIANILEKSLGVQCEVTKNFDTDLFGTFSGEVERKKSALDTARDKCLRAMKTYTCDLAIASEGSFGMHPAIFFAPGDEEILILIDRKNDLEITAKVLSTNTNFGGARITELEELKEFARRARFPTHGLILRSAENDCSNLVKGIMDWEKLLYTCRQFIEKYGAAFVETDMRACYNPARMQVIEQAAQKLIHQINSLCPLCNTPGFGVTEVKAGLPCQVCRYPTQSTLSHIYTCQKCFHKAEIKHPHQKMAEEPTYCDRCNP